MKAAAKRGIQGRKQPVFGILRKSKRLPVLGFLFLLPIVGFGIFGPLISPYPPTVMNLGQALHPPAWMPGGDASHLLGTDHLGRDLASRIIDGARGSLLVSVFGVGLAGLIGVCLGMLAGYFEGAVDNFIMRVVDTVMSIPAILLAILLAAAMGGGMTTIVASIGFIFWTGYARVIRGETLSLKQRDFIALAVVTGCSRTRILLRHIFPNLVNTAVVLATLQLGRAIIIESSLTFLGLGLQPPASAWGLIISEGRMYMSTAWWIPSFSGLAIMLTVLGANLTGDWVRDTLDPRMRQSQ